MFFNDLVDHFKREKEMDRRRTACKNMANGLAFGTLLGLTVGVLFAPKSGKDTRQAIADRTTDTAEQVKKIVAEYVEELKGRMEHVEHNAKEMTGTLKDSLQELKGKVTKDVKEHVREIQGAMPK